MKSLALSALLLLSLTTTAHALQVVWSDMVVRTSNGNIQGHLVAEVSKDSQKTIYSKLQLRASNGQTYDLIDAVLGNTQGIKVENFICSTLEPESRFSQSSPKSAYTTRGGGVVLQADGTAVVLKQTEFGAYAARSSVTCSLVPLAHIGE